MKTCNIEGCERRARSKGLCNKHYVASNYKKAIPQCVWDGCSSTDVKARMFKNRYCPEHLERMILSYATKPTHRRVDVHGYVILTILGIPYREHRLIMERFLGRTLRDGENVHHIDGNRSNNKLKNLELWSTSQPSGQRVSDKIKWANEIIALYGKNPSEF
jgi:hypothetical protein